MVYDILSKFINNLPPKVERLNIKSSDILGVSLLSTKEAERLPKDVRACGEWYWLKDIIPEFWAACVTTTGKIADYTVWNSYMSVRPVLLTNVSSDNFILYNMYKKFAMKWYYIGDGKFLSVDTIGECAFNLESSSDADYENSLIKQYLEDWWGD